MRRFWVAGRLAGAAGLAMAGVAHAETPPTRVAQPPLGVYLWGNNSRKLIDSAGPDAITAPVRVEFFDQQQLRDLAISAGVGVAAMKNGDVVEWTTPRGQQVVLCGKGISQIRVCADGKTVVARGSNGKVFTWSVGDIAGTLKALQIPSLWWFEKIVDIQAGAGHVAALTSRGRVLTSLLKEVDRHTGQLGLASYPSFEQAPAPLQFHIVKLLEETPVAQIASGLNHVLVRTRTGDLLGFGENGFGQLMLPAVFKNNKVSVPTYLIPTRPRRAPAIVNIAAGGNVSYFTDASGATYSAGNGITGQLGTGSFAHCQPQPLRVTAFDNTTEYDEKLGKTVHAHPAAWSVSATHTFAGLDNATRDWMEWGMNLFGQLGNGKKGTAPKPLSIHVGPLAKSVTGTTLVAGDGISACFTKV